MNGSSDTGYCLSFHNSGFISICTDLTSSDLFDGVIPTLTGLDGDMWASQLLTLLNSTGSTIELAFAIVISQLERVELVIFNCPEWRISVQSISLRDNDGRIIGSSGGLNSITSCNSLVRLCVPATAINPLVVTVQFDLDTDSNWVHLAEVTFYNDNTTCPPNTFITTVGPTKPTTTATTTQEMTAATTAALTTPTTTTTTTQGATTVTTAAPTTPTTTATTTQGATTVTTADPKAPTTTATTTQGATAVTTAAPTTPTTTTTTTQGATTVTTADPTTPTTTATTTQGATTVTTADPTTPTTTATTTQGATTVTTADPTTPTTTATTTQGATTVTAADPTTPTTTTITTQGATTVTAADPTTPTTTATTTLEITIVTITIPTIPTIETTTAEEMTTATMESDTTPDNGTVINEGVIIPVVVVICVVFMIMGIMAAVLIQWRYHKHKTSHHTEGHSHPHTHSHPPPVNKYEQTGQVCYSSPPEALRQLSSSHDTYSHLRQSERRGGAQSEGEYSVVHMKECKGKGEYSVLFHANKHHVLERDKMEAMRTGDSTTHVYAQIDGVKKGKKKTGSTGVTTHPAAYSSLDMSKSWEMVKPDTHLYDQVVKGKKCEMAIHLHTPDADTAVNHSYAVLEDNREKKKGEVATHHHTPEADTAVNHSYAVLEDNRQKKKGEVATHHHTPEADTAVDHFYAVLEDNHQKKKGQVASHPHTPEADTAVDQLCAKVDKNQKEKEVCVPLQESGPVYSVLNKPSPPQLPAKSDLLMEDLQTP